MTTMKAFEKFILRVWKVRQGNPRVFVRGQVLPVNKVLVTLTDFPAVTDRTYSLERRVINYTKWFRMSMGMEFRWVAIRFKERNMENWM